MTENPRITPSRTTCGWFFDSWYNSTILSLASLIFFTVPSFFSPTELMTSSISFLTSGMFLANLFHSSVTCCPRSLGCCELELFLVFLLVSDIFTLWRLEIKWIFISEHFVFKYYVFHLKYFWSPKYFLQLIRLYRNITDFSNRK